MNKRLSNLLLGMLCVCLSSNAFASFKLNRTRVINSSESGQEFVIQNKNATLYGGQVWLDSDASNANKGVHFVAHPQLFKLDVGAKQVVRLFQTNTPLPQDRESLFWINVQEIPPKDKSGKSALVMSFRTRIKLIHRPDSILQQRVDAEKQITWSIQGQQVTLYNPTPYYLAVSRINVNGVDIKIEKKKALTPFSQQQLTTLPVLNIKQMSVAAIDDYGATVSYDIKPAAGNLPQHYNKIKGSQHDL